MRNGGALRGRPVCPSDARDMIANIIVATAPVPKACKRRDRVDPTRQQARPQQGEAQNDPAIAQMQHPDDGIANRLVAPPAFQPYGMSQSRDQRAEPDKFLICPEPI